jgi:Bacterial extracellular solute-binding protein/von Willebrand factor type A domain
VTAALVVSVITAAGMTAKAVISQASCSNQPVLVNLAVSFDISPAIQTIARTFNKQHVSAAGRCVEVEVTPGQPSAVAAQIDGQDSLHGLAALDAWIPDSTLWIDVARKYPVGAQVVQPTRISVAKSPIMLVTSQQVANETKVFAGPPSWGLLLTSTYGGPPGSMGLSVDIPDPSDSAVGLSTLIELNRDLGTTVNGRAGLTKFVLSSEDTEDFDSVPALTQFVASAGAPFDRRSIAEASEQAVVLYDQANPRQPLAARYPTGPAKALGSPELDYPYVLTSTNRAMARAVAAFGKFLQSSYAQTVIRNDGFRSADGVANKFPANSGLSSQPLQIAPAAKPAEAATNLVAWQKLGLGSKDLTIIDDSAAMAAPAGVGNLTLEQTLSATAARGLALFPDSTQMSLWVAPDSKGTASSYRDLVSMGPLPARYGVITRREQIQEVDQTLTTTTKNPLHLNDAIVAAYQQMTKTYAPNYSNAVIVLTAGIDAPGDMSVSALLARLHGLFSSDRPVEIVILQFGQAGNFHAMQQIASATDGAAYQILSPKQVGKVFIQAIARRI